MSGSSSPSTIRAGRGCTGRRRTALGRSSTGSTIDGPRRSESPDRRTLLKLSRFFLLVPAAVFACSGPLAALTLYSARDIPLPDAARVSASVSAYNQKWTNLSNDEKKRRNQAVQAANAANALQDQGRSLEAYDKYQQAYKIWPDLLETGVSFAAVCYSLKRYDEALKSVSLYLDRYDGLDARAWKLTGLARFGLKDYELACQDLFRSARLAGNDPGIWTLIANVYFEAGDFPNAATLYDSALKAAPGDPKNWLGAGETALRRKDLPSAERYFSSGLKAVPGDADLAEGLKKVKLLGLVAKANALIGKQKYADAIAVLQEAVSVAPGQYPAYVELGKLYFQLNRMKEAEVELGKARDLKADSPEVYYYLGIIAQQSGEADKALENYDSAVILGMTGFDLRNNMGALYVQKGFYDKALEILAEALRERPASESALVNTGLAWYEKSEYQKASDAFGAALALNRKNADAATNFAKAKAMLLVQDGNRAFDAKDFNTALLRYQEALKTYRNFPDAEVNLANSLLELGQAQNALAVLLPLYAKNTNSYAVIESLAAVYERTGSPDRAKEFTARLGGLQDRDPLVWYRLGLNYELNGKLDKALEAYQSCLKIDPKFRKAVLRTAQVWYKLGIAEYNASRFDAALTNLGRALAAQPDNPDVRNRIQYIKAFKVIAAAIAGFKDGDYESSIGLYQEADRTYPGIPETYYGLGQDYFELGRFTNAASWLERSVQIRSNFIEAYKLLAEVLRKQQRYVEASLALNRAVGMSPKDPELYTSLGYIFYLNNDIENAKQMYRKAIMLNPTEADPHVNLGLVYFKEGDYATAEREFLAADTLRPNMDDVYFDLGLVYFKQNRFRDAERVLLRSIELNAEIADKYFNLARTLYNIEGRADDAVQNGLTALKMRNDPRYHYGLGKIYEKKMVSARQSEIDRYRELAIAEYQAVVRMAAGTQLSAWAEERLKALLQEVRLARLYRVQGRVEGQLLVDNGDVFAGSSDGSLSAYSPQSEEDGGIRWQFRSDSAFRGGPVLKNGVLYAADARSVYALDRTDGRILWSRDLGEAVTSSVAEENGTVYAGGRSGTWYAVTRDGAVPVHSTGAACSGKPLVAGQVLIGVDAFGTVSAFDLAGRRPLWSFQTGAAVRADLLAWQNLVLVFGEDSMAYALDRSTGRRVWTFAAGVPFACGGAVANNTLYFAAGAMFYAVSAEGRELWRLRLPEPAVSISTVNARNNLIVGGAGATLFCVNLSEQKIRWKYRLEDAAGPPFLVGEGAGYFSSADGGIYHLEFLK